MKVRIAVQVSGSRDGVMWPKPGEELEVPDDEAESLIGMGIAKPLDAPEDPPVVEENAKLDEPAEETATVPSGNKAVNASKAKDGS